MDEVRAAGAAVAVLLLALLTACSGDDEPATEGTPPPSVPVWNPCDALDVADVSTWFGSELTMQTGTTEAPECTLTPGLDGDPVLNANYMQSVGDLDDAFATMGLDPEDVREVRVPGADAARIVVDFDDQQLFVSGFVQDDNLIQTVDVVDPEPYDEALVVRGVRSVLGELSAAAP